MPLHGMQLTTALLLIFNLVKINKLAQQITLVTSLDQPTSLVSHSSFSEDL
jgi:hypothetical protein